MERRPTATDRPAGMGARTSVGGAVGGAGRHRLRSRGEDEPHVHDVFAVHFGGGWTQGLCRSRHNWIVWAFVSMMMVVVVIWAAAGFGVIDLNDPPY